MNNNSVDCDDAISFLHDYLYAEFGKEYVAVSDNAAIDLFLTDFADTYNLHSLLGAVGQAKKHWETIFGTVCASMSHKGKSDYTGLYVCITKIK